MRSVRRTNCRAIAMMFIRLSVRLSVCPSGTGVHCDHTVLFGADFSLRLDSPMFWLPLSPKQVHQLPAVFFQFHLEDMWGMDDGMNCKLRVISQERLKIEVKLVLSANRKAYVPRRLAQ